MKKIFLIINFIIIQVYIFSAFSQSPQKFSYQTVVRNSGGQLLANQAIAVKISILQGSENGNVVYAERHTPTTNANGLASLQIGGGTVLNGSMASINWAQGPYFISTETDPNGGTNYTIASTQQLLSVPYALYANSTSSSVSSSGDTLFLGNQSYIIPGISAANNSSGQTGITQHTCGADSVHNPTKNYGTMTDQEGNVYKTIVIGTQEWMAENLKTSSYRNGELIASVTDNNQWYSLTTGAWCFYNNDSQYECPYGKLYNWYAVSDLRNVCPLGWHVPNDAEWRILINYLDPNSFEGDSINIAGGKMKSKGIQYWIAPNIGATNESGFSGLPGGVTSGNMGYMGAWWSSTAYNSNYSWIWMLSNHLDTSYHNWVWMPAGWAIRCIKD